MRVGHDLAYDAGEAGMTIEITSEHEATHERLRALVHLDVSDVI